MIDVMKVIFYNNWKISKVETIVVYKLKCRLIELRPLKPSTYHHKCSDKYKRITINQLMVHLAIMLLRENFLSPICRYIQAVYNLEFVCTTVNGLEQCFCISARFIHQRSKNKPCLNLWLSVQSRACFWLFFNGIQVHVFLQVQIFFSALYMREKVKGYFWS